MEARTERLVSAYDGSGTTFSAEVNGHENDVTVDRHVRYGEVTFEVSWWSGKAKTASHISEMVDALRAADTHIHSVKTDSVYVVEWQGDDDKAHWQGVMHRSLEEAKRYLEERSQSIRARVPDRPTPLPFEIACSFGTWKELKSE